MYVMPKPRVVALSFGFALALVGAGLGSACASKDDAGKPEEPAKAASPEQAPAGEAKVDAAGLPEGPLPDRDPALAKTLVAGGALLLDVRTPEEFGDGHIEGAVNIDHGQVDARLDEIRELVGGDLHKPVVVYCKSGRRAGLVKDQLLAAGFDRVTNLGGYTDW